MPRSGQGGWLIYIRIDKQSAIRVYFPTEQDAIAANRELLESVEDARMQKRSIAYCNGGRVAVDVKRFVSAEVLSAGQDPDTPVMFIR